MISSQPHRADQDAEKADRDRWRRTRRPGTRSATFGPGDRLRCPGTVSTDWGDCPCGRKMGQAKAGTRVVIRVKDARAKDLPLIGTDLTPCPDCGAHLEQYVAPTLEATG